MPRPFDPELAFETVLKDQAELTFAFYAFVALVSGVLSRGLPADLASLAEQFERMAGQSGGALSDIVGNASAANPHLQFIAETLRSVCISGRVTPTNDV